MIGFSNLANLRPLLNIYYIFIINGSSTTIRIAQEGHSFTLSQSSIHLAVGWRHRIRHCLLYRYEGVEEIMLN